MADFLLVWLLLVSVVGWLCLLLLQAIRHERFQESMRTHVHPQEREQDAD